MTYMALPHEMGDLVLLVDDGSTDGTIKIASELNLQIFLHNRNYGYGANQKTCYIEALKAAADIIVMVHPALPIRSSLLAGYHSPLEAGQADVVFGSRLLGNSAVRQGMPWWKYLGNRVLTKFENMFLNLRLSEYHTGYKGLQQRVLETINFQANSDGFISIRKWSCRLLRLNSE
jgi:glycosyltransferase involved in cell wall biosynthesis